MAVTNGVRIKNTIGLTGAVVFLGGEVIFDDFGRAIVEREVARELLRIPGYWADDGVYEVVDVQEGQESVAGGATLLDTKKPGSGDPGLVLGHIERHAKATVLETREIVKNVTAKVDAERLRLLEKGKKPVEVKPVLPKELEALDKVDIDLNSLDLNSLCDDGAEAEKLLREFGKAESGGLEVSAAVGNRFVAEAEVKEIEGKRGVAKKGRPKKDA